MRRCRRHGLSALLAMMAALLAAGPFAVVTLGSSTAAPRGCWPTETPLGALPPVLVIWCHEPLATGPATVGQGPNSWFDLFEHGLSNAELGTGYRVFDANDGVFKSQHFRHNNHWMVDVVGRGPAGEGSNKGGATMRPDRSFRFLGGRLVVEATVAAGIEEYRGSAWPELVVTTAPAPSGNRTDNLYSYDIFGSHWTVGCRLHSDGHTICSMFDDSLRGATNGGRVWEMSFFQQVGATNFGGFRGGWWGDAYRACQGTDADLYCRDHFRLELTQTSLSLFVNDVKYFEQTGLSGRNMLPDALLNGDVYVYYSSWIASAPTSSVRFHWNTLLINADELFASAPTPASNARR